MPNGLFTPRNPLLIPDLFHCVLECLLTPLPRHLSKEEQRTLAALAQTCRAFSEPSLNYLWRQLNSLPPLIRCFSDVVNRNKVKNPPSTHDWLVVRRYSYRVQELTLGDEELSLCFLQHTRLVLPNLKVFKWRCLRMSGFIPISPLPEIESSFDMTSLWPLLTPRIETLEVQLRSLSDPRYPLFLQHYPNLCPDLKSIKFEFLHLGMFEDHQCTFRALSRAVRSKADWRHVELQHPVDDAVLSHIGISSILKTVSLNLEPQTSWPDSCFGPEDTPFRNVTNFALTLQNSLDVATHLLRPRDQVFRSFEVVLYELTTATEVSTLLSALASPQRIHSLQSIIIEHFPGIMGKPTPAHEHLSYETFHPLLSFIHLRKLVISLNHPTSLNYREFADLVRNWPQIEVFKLMCAPGEPEDPETSGPLTLQALLSLLASCRELREIGLTLDARDVPSGPYTHSDVCNPFITSPIMLCNVRIKDPDLVAGFLLKHLPSISGVSGV